MTRMVLTLLLCTVAGTASAQLTASDEATTSLTVVSGLSVAKVADITFGEITAGEDQVTLTPDGNTDGLYTGGTTAGQFTVTGNDGAVVSVDAASFSDVTLTETVGGTATLGFTPQVFTSTNVADELTSGDADFTLDGTGGATLYIGGTVTVPTGTLTGTYEGTYTLSVSYVSI